jgi:UrcA family protein
MTQTFTLVRSASLAMIATACVMLAPAARAADEQVPQGELNIAGTDFTSARAVDHLIARLHRVATDICVTEARAPFTTDDQRTCIKTAINSGMVQIEARRQQAMRDTATRLAAATPVQ